jgi:hypothetical protein
LFAAAGVVALVVGIVMLRMGLEKADQLGSVIGSITGLVGLGVAAYALVLALRADHRDTEPTPTNSVVNSKIKGPNIQIGQANDVHIEHEK